MATVKEVMVTKIWAIEESARIIDAVREIDTHKIGSLIITSNRNPIGIVTTTDILSKAVLAGLNLKKTKITKIMSKPLITTNPDASLEEAAALMSGKKIKKLPVIDQNQKLVGIITTTDLVMHSPKFVNVLIELRSAKLSQALGAAA